MANSLYEMYLQRIHSSCFNHRGLDVCSDVSNYRAHAGASHRRNWPLSSKRKLAIVLIEGIPHLLRLLITRELCQSTVAIFAAQLILSDVLGNRSLVHHDQKVASVGYW